MGMMNELDHFFIRFGNLTDPSISSSMFAAAPSGAYPL